MRALAEECIEWMKKKDLFDCFIILAKASSEWANHYVRIHDMSIEEAVSLVKDKNKEICEQKIISKIESLIYFGFFRYKDFEFGRIPNISYSETIGILDDKYDSELAVYQNEHPTEKATRIILSEKADISGRFIIEEIYKEEDKKEIEQNLADAFAPIETEYKQYVDESKKELEKKIAAIENGTIKSIEIISVFTAIIGLFISNVVGIVNEGTLSVKLLVVINISIVTSIFCLICFVRLLVKEKNEKYFMWKTLIIFALFLLVSMILIA